MTGFNPPLIFLRATDNEGLPAPGAKLYHDVSGTDIPKDIFYDVEMTSPCPYPLVADAEGRFAQFFMESGAYKFTLFDQNDVQLRPPEDPVFGDGGGQFANDYFATEIQSPGVNGAINWMEDLANELWENPEAPLAFRIDFKRRPFTKLKFVKTEFSAHTSFSVGKIAIYGDLATKLYEGPLPDVTGVLVFDDAIDISAYEYIVVVMDPGVSTSPQPLSQSISVMPASTALSRYAFAGTFVHEHNTPFPETCPPMIYSDIKYFLARWCILGML